MDRGTGGPACAPARAASAKAEFACGAGAVRPASEEEAYQAESEDAAEVDGGRRGEGPSGSQLPPRS